MKCPLCGHSKAHKHGKMPNGHQRYLCPAWGQTFSENFGLSATFGEAGNSRKLKPTIYVRQIDDRSLFHQKSRRARFHANQQKAQLVHNVEVQAVQTEKVSGDELWSFVSKNKSSA